MTASERSVNPAQASPGSQRRRAAANAAVDSSPSKRTPRATHTPNKITKFEVNGAEDNDTPGIPGKRKKIEAVVTEKVPLALAEGAAPKTKKRKEVKQETEEIQEQEPKAVQISAKAKRKRNVEEDQEPADPPVDGGSPKTAKRKRIVKVEEAEIKVVKPSPEKTKRKKAAEVEIEETVEGEVSPQKAKRKKTVKEEDEEVQGGEEGQKKTKRKRKTKEEKELEAMPLATRTNGVRMFIGAHVSGAKGWSFSMSVALELRLFHESRSSKCGNKLRAYRVNNLPVLQPYHA